MLKKLANKYVADCKDHAETGRNHWEWLPVIYIFFVGLGSLINDLFKTK